MNAILSNTPKRSPILSGAALLLAALQFGTAAILACFWFVQRQQPTRNLEWGEGVGGIVFLVGFVLAHMALIVVGLLLTIFSVFRREQPKWLRETALAIYGSAALGVVALVIWRLFPA